ncbi:MAG: hypothetical protein E4H44_02295 [Candidatus Aminicenantes bacterium]|nr:MAG: hypothetical protein E4H44_02295 [Candidatus Aminicenantes bacterium]
MTVFDNWVITAVNNPGGAAGISLGDMGTVVCGSNTGSGNILISWDNWSGGHNGNGFCGCPVTSLTDSSGWYVACGLISREHGYVFSDSFYTGDTTHWD